MSKLLSEKAVCELTSLSRASVRRGVEAGTFPAPLALGERKLNKLGRVTGRIAWVEEEIKKWIADRLKLGRIVRLESRP